MRKITLIFICLILLAILLGACAPSTYISPVNIHITPGDEIQQVRITVDAAGRKHITGVVDDRIVYYRTQLGEEELALTMTMTGSGTNWIQFTPDIAVTDGGDAYIVWVEQRGGTDKFACYRDIPATPPGGGYQTECRLLHTTSNTTGIVRAAGRGDVVYVIYDRNYILYPHLTHFLQYINLLEDITGTVEILDGGEIQKIDLAIDSAGKLHVAYSEKISDFPYRRLEYRSNAQVSIGDRMDQKKTIVFSDLKFDVMPSITFHEYDGPEKVAIASVKEGSYDRFIINSCIASDCSSYQQSTLPLPLLDWAEAEIFEAKILGFEAVYPYYAVSFIAKRTPTSHPQLWYWITPFDDAPLQVTDSARNKYNLAMVDGGVPILGFMEQWTVLSTHYDGISIYDDFSGLREIRSALCKGTNLGSGYMAAKQISNAYNAVAGVWNVCGKTWFSTNYVPGMVIYLPLILR